MMSTKTVIRNLCAATLMCAALAVQALDANHFASSSRLSQGHWVKVSVTQSGIHEISKAQLAEMGFNNPEKVLVYGYGGKILSDILTNALPDDLEQIPVLRRQDKICFYATGTAEMTVNTTGALPAFARKRNTYTTRGYYFLIEDNSQSACAPTQVAYDPSASEAVGTSMNYYLHETEARSLSFTGSELLGEDITQGNKQFAYQLQHPSDNKLTVTTRIASKIVSATEGDTTTLRGRFRCYVIQNGATTEVPYTATTARIYDSSSRKYTFYETGSATEQLELPSASAAGNLRFLVEESTGRGLIQVSLLDYFIITYNQNNSVLQVPNGQCLMGFAQTNATDKVMVQGPLSTVVWDVTDDRMPIAMAVQPDGDGVGFTPGANSQGRTYIAFDPEQSLMSIAGYEVVPNQNLHSLPVPEMLIITNSTFMPQAERVADLHRQHDGMDVAVVDQQHIFNEFSSGAPSALAYRLLCKMFYDRDSSKFKHLLLFGHCSFDNRGLASEKKDRLMSYQTSVSNYDDESHVIEDYFGYLNDNSGRNLSNDLLCIGVGRMPSSSLAEAKSNVDKLYEYVLSPDYGNWRNNYSIWAEKSTKLENKLHEKQADGIDYMLTNDLKTQMMADRAFVGMYPRNVTETFVSEDKRPSTEARKHIKEMLNEGQYFATYVGHAGPTMFTTSSMWTADEANNFSYARWPIMTTACCDVARFDSDHRGIAELMFHKRDGGAIALFTTARQVYANGNDFMNRSFVTAMFCYNADKRMPTLGEVYQKTKCAYRNVSNSNKLNFLLLGDPALKVNYPKPLFQLTKVNGVNVSGGAAVSVYPLQEVTVEARVLTEDAAQPTLNTQFNGDATISLYDLKRSFMTVNGTGDHDGETHTVNYPQELLARVTGRVVNGVLTAKFVVPRYARSRGNDCTLTIYAHEDGTDQMVNGRIDNIRVATYNSAKAVSDDVSPVIEAMYLNDEADFSNSTLVGSEAVAYIRVTDNLAFNVQAQHMGMSTQLKLDGGKTSYNLNQGNIATRDQGRVMDVVVPLKRLTPGQHTLDFAVSDVCGNRATKSIAFVVSGNSDITIGCNDRSSTQEAVVNLLHHNLSSAPTLNMKVTNMRGETVWAQPVSSFPMTWDLTDNDGERVPAGLYKIHGNYDHPDGYGGTNIINFVVLRPIAR